MAIEKSNSCFYEGDIYAKVMKMEEFEEVNYMLASTFEYLASNVLHKKINLS